MHFYCHDSSHAFYYSSHKVYWNKWRRKFHKIRKLFKIQKFSNLTGLLVIFKFSKGLVKKLLNANDLWVFRDFSLVKEEVIGEFQHTKTQLTEVSKLRLVFLHGQLHSWLFLVFTMVHFILLFSIFSKVNENFFDGCSKKTAGKKKLHNFVLHLNFCRPQICFSLLLFQSPVYFLLNRFSQQRYSSKFFLGL